MAQATLLDSDIEAGRLLVEALDAADFHVSAALWVFNEEGEEYRLMVASPFVEKHGKHKAYTKIALVLVKSDLERRLPLIRVQAVRRDEPIVAAVRRVARTGERGLAGMRLTNNLVDGFYIPDVYVYRAA